ncbi:MAG: 50S ribosomal protein L29 [Tenuifilum sp.]|uniref:50S ribosomal protein L29 n=1 Tax=Tenuifilum sp. TaxID=2760880 RepID=UPI0017754667|nr:50S ribosomal protein L29 [Bacteroidales bacterium]HOK61014.1 50S ribosomal protein L29 [Tenuifilum sp.]MBP7169282.1 50S ribosomal protein L29 [Bacteroidales bacterium]MBP9028751.1 50S ribosomal protein L29 [Bacteroidales bacterium]HDP75058.1 50S ribosomal protein L29 [Bacteroidales bacterium]
MKVAEIRELTDKEILERIELEKTNLLKLRLNHSISPLDNPMKIKETRRNIARLQTVLNQRKLSQNK